MPLSQSSAPRAFPPSAPFAWAGLGAQAQEHSPPPPAEAIGERLWSEDGPDAARLKSLWTNQRRAHRLFTVGAVNSSHVHGEREIAGPRAAFERAADRLASAPRQAALHRGPAPPRESGDGHPPGRLTP